MLKLTYLIIATMVLVSSCSTYKYTGSTEGSSWTKSDINRAEKELNLVKDQVEELLGKGTDDYMDCYMYKVITKYPNFDIANKDQPGCTLLAEQCMKELAN